MDSEVLTMEGADNVETNKAIRHERSDIDEESWRENKIFKPNEFDFSSKNALSEQGSIFMTSGSMVSGDDGQTMLCFSSTSSKAQEPSFLSGVGGDTSSRNQELAIIQAQQASLYAKGNVSARCPEGVYGPFSRYKGPFTPSQWMELEHQALIYKHFVANVPVPLNLLIPFKKSLNPYAFSSLSSGSYVSNPLGWGSFHLGFSGNNDPEPGRCRRTDGKKWRCSRDACPDQKYCERHINRGRHRSRKPVEGQTGHAVSGSTAPKVAPLASSSAPVMSSSSAAKSLGAIQHQFTNSQPSSANPSTNHLVSRIHNPRSLMSNDSPFSAQKQHAAFEDSTQEAFGLVSSDSLLNPSQKGLFMNSGNSSSLPTFNGEETQAQNPLHLFIDKWPKPQSDSASVVWPGELKSDWTQLSMSIPMTSSDFLSSSNSPQAKKLTLSPLRLAGQFDPIQMGLSVSNNSDKSIEKHTHWRPLPWESSMGGPLGEVLNKTPINPEGSKNSSSVNLGTDGWSTSPQLRSSPTGVLQKSTFISLSNSSAGSSPRGDNNEAREAANFCNALLGSTLASSSCTPSM